MEKAEAAVDAMDGLSDSDLETLLKNFNELSAEEQHSLIAYLKKLEAREPQRVERLRQYVGAAAPNAAPILHELPQHKETACVTIQSDDDEDYSVDEVSFRMHPRNDINNIENCVDTRTCVKKVNTRSFYANLNTRIIAFLSMNLSSR